MSKEFAEGEGRAKPDTGGVANRVRAVRTRLGLSQQDLARSAGVTRQTISGVEAGLYAPSASVALRLARTLGVRMEELFWLEDDLPTINAVPYPAPEQGEENSRCALARVGGQWIAYPLTGDSAFRAEMVPADGTVVEEDGGAFTVRLLDAADAVARTVVIAGCAPALSLWARSAERRHTGLRAHWLHANSRAALDALLEGRVHAAGVHVYDEASGESNLPFVRSVVQERGGEGVTPILLINLGIWEEGLLVAPGNPKGISSAEDLARTNVTLVNREPGAGARLLLDGLLQTAGIAGQQVRDYGELANGHAAVARTVASGAADVGVSTAGTAAAYGLGFVALRRVRYDLAVRRSYLEEAPVQQLFDALGQRWVRSQLAALGGYDTALTGDIVGEVA